MHMHFKTNEHLNDRCKIFYAFLLGGGVAISMQARPYDHTLIRPAVVQSDYYIKSKYS